MKILVVVDCQSGFNINDRLDLVKNTRKKIREFKKRNDSIIVLEYRGYKRTVGSITRLLKNYPDGVFLLKDYNDGSDEIEDHLDRYDTSEITEIQFCGVNLNCCVIDTEIGLGKKYPEIDMTILYECCGADDGMEYATNTVLNIQKQHDNVCLVDAEGPMY